jgi:hypothetical protein
MILTNNYELPEPYVDLVQEYLKQYSKGGADYSATELYRPPYQRRLEIEHKDEITSDVSDHVYKLLGSAFHFYAEHLLRGVETYSKVLLKNIKKYEIEERLFAELDGKTISGQADIITSKQIFDWKVTGVWGLRRVKEEWMYQLNILRWLAFKNGKERSTDRGGKGIQGLCNIGIGRDWMWRQAQKGRKEGNNYPPIPVVAINHNKWSPKKTEAFIRARIILHETTMNLPLDQVEPCSDRDRWHQNQKFKVMKPGRETSLRNLDTYEEAEEWIAHQQDSVGLKIENNPGEYVRCERFCDVKQWCKAYQGSKPKESEGNDGS